ncbi:MAG: type I-C CRISPR-associated protein Cas8c/Csd1 [Terrimicrobiaceae bacterium]|nr:type I-C CRISPR-associated protein Cas8c/Csd1 [Terrimicrobiaceae bacterium]
MLLKHLYDFAVSRHLLDDDAFESKAIRFVIQLDARGHFLGVQDISPDGKRGFDFPAVPKTPRAKKGKVAEFLADGIDSIFGLSPKPNEPKDANMLRDKFNDFWDQISDAERSTQFPALRALLQFKPIPGTPPSFLNIEDSKWLVTTAGGAKVRLAGAVFTFRVSDVVMHSEPSVIAPYWRSIFARTIAEQEKDSMLGTCLITGESNVPIARTHSPRIKKIPNVGIDGTIVCFESDAFSSYGKIQSNNAPCSIPATRAYSKALQFLVEHEDHHVKVGETKLCFWAAKTPISKTPLGFLNRPDPKAVRDFVRSPFSGIERETAKVDRFYAVTVGGNSGRVVIRHWMNVSLEQAVKNLHQWFLDLEITVPAPRPKREPKAGGKEKDFHPLSLYWLSCTTVREAKNIRSETTAQLYRAALEGTAPSITLLGPILKQLHSRIVRDGFSNLLFEESRFALLKLILNRQPNRSMEIQPKLTADTKDAAYNCGRLLAILSDTQAKAHEFKLEGPGVAERYFGTASVSPSSVFPLLIRLNRHHLNKISKSERFSGHERPIQKQIEAVMVLFRPARAGLPPTFPRTLDLQAQGRFALGFYQQHAEDAAARQPNITNQTPILAPVPNN